MFRNHALLCILLMPLQAIAQEADSLALREQLDRPYVALFDLVTSASSQSRARNLRSTIEADRKQRIDDCESAEKSLKRQVEAARAGLKQLNATSSTDTATGAGLRSSLHTEISALERVLRDKQQECEHLIPAEFEIKLAKAHLLEHWPQRRAEAARVIESGRARTRKHGDVDDIGYRKLADDQEKDVAIGEQAVRQMNSSGLVSSQVQDVAVREYVQHLAERIGRSSDLKVPVHVTVLDGRDVNAIGLPGGFLLVTSGLILACDNESELAAVLAQQIAHVAARHATRASKRSILARAFIPAAQIVTGLFSGGLTNAGAYYGMNYGFQGLGVVVDKALVSSKAGAKKEADQLGIQYAWRAGFDPKGYIAFLDSLAGRGREYADRDKYFLTKPPLGERLVDAFTEIQYLPVKENATVDSEDFRMARQRLQAFAKRSEERR